MALSLADELELDLELDMGLGGGHGGGGGGMTLADDTLGDEFGGGGDDLAAELDAALGGGALGDDEGGDAVSGNLGDDLGDDLARELGTTSDADDVNVDVDDAGDVVANRHGALPSAHAATGDRRTTTARVVSARATPPDPTPAPLELAPLYEAMEASARMCDLLRRLDTAAAARPSSAVPVVGEGGGSVASGRTSSPVPASAQPHFPSSASDSASASAASPAATAPPPVPIDDRLASYIQHVAASERARDEQTRDAAALVRDLSELTAPVLDEDVRWVDLVLDEGDSRGGVNGHGRGGGYDRDGSDTLDSADARQPNGNGVLDTIAESPSPDLRDSPPRPTWPVSLGGAVRGAPHDNGSGDGGDGAPIASAVAALWRDSASAASALGSLRDGASVGATSAAGAARTLRGVRLALRSLRDGQAAEDAAQRAVDAYEASEHGTQRAAALMHSVTSGLDARLAELARAHAARCRRPCPVP